MSIEINAGKCIGCMSCKTVCPSSLFAADPQTGKPFPEHPEWCIGCMHCAAICPQGAVTFSGGEACLSEAGEKAVTMGGGGYAEELKRFILRRRSYRHFSNIAVPRSIIENAINATAWSPSAKNEHPVGWIIVDDREKIAKILSMIHEYVDSSGEYREITYYYKKRDNNVVCGDSGCLVFTYSAKQATSPLIDAAIAMTHFEMILQSQGVGTCWAGYLQGMAAIIPELTEMLGVPAGAKIRTAMFLGWPGDERYPNIPARAKKPDITWL